MSNALKAILILVCWIGGCATCVVLTRSTPKERAEAKAKDEAIAASASAEEARREKETEERWRKECKTPPPKMILPIEDEKLRRICHGMIRESLNDPDSAQFPPTSTGDDFKTDDGCNRFYYPRIRAKNGFGALVLEEFECKYDPRIGVPTVRRSHR